MPDETGLPPRQAYASPLARTLSLPGLAVELEEMDSGVAAIDAEATLDPATGRGTTAWLARDPSTLEEHIRAVRQFTNTTWASGDGGVGSPPEGCWSRIGRADVDGYLQFARPGTMAGLDLLAAADVVGRARGSAEVLRARVPLSVAVRHIGSGLPVLRDGISVGGLRGSVPVMIELDDGLVDEWTLGAWPVFAAIEDRIDRDSVWWAGAERRVSLAPAEVEAPSPPDPEDVWGLGEGDCADGGVGVNRA